MRVPDVLVSLADQGVIDEVVRPLKSGKEAQVYLVTVDGVERVAKVYKDSQNRSFKQRAQYMEGRRVRNSRDQRAIQRRTRHGKAQEEAAWKSAEVNVIHRLHAQGVRVPTPYNFIDGVLIMELVTGDDGEPAPRLGELAFSRDEAHAIFDRLLREVVKMLCAGIVHGDLSDFNILVDGGGPVIIDFPQSVDAAANANAKKLLVRDVDNLSAFLARNVPGTRRRPYGQELWAAYESNQLTPELELTGQHRRSNKVANMDALLDEIADAENDERRRREAAGEPAPLPRRREVIMAPAGGRDARGGRGGGGGGGGGGGRGRGRGGSGANASEAGARRGRGSRGGGGRSDGRNDDRRRGAAGEPARGERSPRSGGAAEAEGAPKKRRRRRRGAGGGAGGGAAGGGGAGAGAGRAGASGGAGRATARVKGNGGGSGNGRPPPGNGAQPAAGAGVDGAPKRRRRRRRRRGPGTSGTPTPSAGE